MVRSRIRANSSQSWELLSTKLKQFKATRTDAREIVIKGIAILHQCGCSLNMTVAYAMAQIAKYYSFAIPYVRRTPAPNGHAFTFGVSTSGTGAHILAPTSGLFGTNNATGGAHVFGIPVPTSGLFGTNKPTGGAPVFGTPAFTFGLTPVTTSGLFGTPTFTFDSQTSLFGTNKPTSGLFGTGAPTSGLFAAKPITFGAPTAAANSTTQGLFAAKPITYVFGAPVFTFPITSCSAPAVTSCVDGLKKELAKIDHFIDLLDTMKPKI